jgi:hypothetical protein
MLYALADQRSQNSDQAQRPDFVGIETEPSCKMHRRGKAGDQRQSRERTVGRNGNVAELEQAGIQIRKENYKTDPLGRG